MLDGLPQPLEIAHLPYRAGKTYEDFLGKRGLDRAGKKRWRRLVFEIVPRLQEAFQVDEVVLGGGNSKLLRTLPLGCRRGDNKNAFAGGFRLFPSRSGTDRRGSGADPGPAPRAEIGRCSFRSATRRTPRASPSSPTRSSRRTWRRSCC